MYALGRAIRGGAGQLSGLSQLYVLDVFDFQAYLVLLSKSRKHPKCLFPPVAQKVNESTMTVMSKGVDICSTLHVKYSY